MSATLPCFAGAVETTSFKQAAGRWATGCAVVTTVDADGHWHGATMSAVTSLSLDPMQFLICLDKRARSLAALRASGTFAINFLSSDQRALAKQFASKMTDKFANLDCPTMGRLPILPGALAHIICHVARILDGGDHDIIIGDVRDLAYCDGEPLLHFRGDFGHFSPVDG
jgi:flavin reductase (DIM6/NTAB) family NADH-FMN oxidoreductase RutF